MRWPGSRASALISIVRSPTSGTSRSNSRWISSGCDAAEDDLHGAGRVAHFQDQRLDALAGLVLLAGDLLASAA